MQNFKTMRNIYKILVAVILSFSLFACSDELLDKQPLDKFSEASVWQDLTWPRHMSITSTRYCLSWAGMNG
jgi:uncharacterized lipoprotein YehR (DUF1307 family)